VAARRYNAPGTEVSESQDDCPTMKITSTMASVLSLLWLAGGAAAQSAPPSSANVQKFERQVDQMQRDTEQSVIGNVPAVDRAMIDYGGYSTVSYLSFDDAAHDNHALRQYELVGYGRLNLDGAHEFYVRGRSDYRDWNAGDSFENEPSTLGGEIEEGWYQFDLKRYLQAYQNKTITGDLVIKGGRQFADWGNGLTLDQYVDGITSQIRSGPLVIDFLAGVTVKETIDFDISRPDFDHNTHRGYYGAKLTVPIGAQHPYVYFLGERDYNRDQALDAHVLPTRYDYNSYYVGLGCDGALSDNLAYSGEACFEGGEGLSNSFDATSSVPVPQTNDRISAYALDLRFDYLLNDTHKTRFVLQGALASGDSDRQNTSATFGGTPPHSVDHAFNGLGVIYTGLAFTPPVSNLVVLRAGASTFPVPHGKWLHDLQLGLDLLYFAKTERDAPIDEPTGTGRYLGFEPDVSVNWQITDDVTFALRYGVFFPGEAIPSGDAHDVRQFLYSGVTYAF
jgi:outer membrane murein-binding lipoprotein Lpp